ncbi:EF-hand and coiled-coil domain-containing protein 1 isoform X1 [Arapaima gigas]
MDRSDSGDPYRRPARRTQWIVSALAYHYGLDRGVENEIIVLATGLDQYLQEIFHHLDSRGLGKVPAEDFHLLCAVLGLGGDAHLEESRDVLDDLPAELSFRQFHAKLCGYFSTKAGCHYESGRLLVGRESEHIETQIRLRGPLRRRERVARETGSCMRECYEEVVALEEAEERVAKLEDENASLRELVEDMRAALQSSDARALALQVGLWKSQSRHLTEGGSPLSHQQALHPPLRDGEGTCSGCDDNPTEDTLRSLEDTNRRLRREQALMRRKVEEARQALLGSLAKVKELEAKAGRVPLLQHRLQQVETELLRCRSEVSKLQAPCNRTGHPEYSSSSAPNRRCCLTSQQDRHSPTGRSEVAPEHGEEQLLRSVEGQAASDEEEEKWTGEQQSQVAEVKKILTRLSCCGDRCDDKALKRLLSHFGGSRSEESHSAVMQLLEKVTKLSRQLELKESQAHKAQMDMDQMKDSLLLELQQKAEETELLHAELQMLETERVRLSLVEEKLMDVLQLLQQLRDLNVSRRSLGKILLSTLESCSDPQHGKAHILEVLNALYHELTACELLSTEPLKQTQSGQSLTNTLLITC